MYRQIWKILCLWIFVQGIGSFLTLAQAELYKWVDESGAVHFTDDLTNVPLKQRPQAEKEGQDAQENPNIQINLIPNNTKSPSSYKSSNQFNKSISPSSARQNEAHWQKRIKDARDDLTQAKNELDETLMARRKNLESGPGMQERQSQLAEKESALQKKIEDLEYQVNEGIAEEARKAGVPPGWVR